MRDCVRGGEGGNNKTPQDSSCGVSRQIRTAEVGGLNSGSPLDASKRTNGRTPAESGECATARGYSVSLIRSRPGEGGSSLKTTRGRGTLSG